MCHPWNLTLFQDEIFQPFFSIPCPRSTRIKNRPYWRVKKTKRLGKVKKCLRNLQDVCEDPVQLNRFLTPWSLWQYWKKIDLIFSWEIQNEFSHIKRSHCIKYISNLSFNPLPSITLKESKRFYSLYCRTLSKINSEYSVLSSLNCIQEKNPEFLLKMSATWFGKSFHSKSFSAF